MFSRRINFSPNYSKSWKISKSHSLLKFLKNRRKIWKTFFFSNGFSQIRTWACSRTCLILASPIVENFLWSKKTTFIWPFLSGQHCSTSERFEITNSAWFLSVISNGSLSRPFLPRLYWRCAVVQHDRGNRALTRYWRE